MPICRECGKEIQEDWISCPYCSTSLTIKSGDASETPFIDESFEQTTVERKTSTVEELEEDIQNKTDNTTLWNVVIVISVIAILVYPTGPLGLTIIEKASFDCEEWSEGDYSILEKCKGMNSDNTAYIFLTVFIAIIALLVNNKKNEEAGNAKRIEEAGNAKRIEEAKERPKRKELTKEQKNTRSLLMVNLILIPIVGVILTLSIDLNPDEFICENGESIQSDLINDNIVDCSDGSDEKVADNGWIWEQNLSQVVPILLIGLVVIFFINYSGLKNGTKKSK